MSFRIYSKELGNFVRETKLIPKQRKYTDTIKQYDKYIVLEQASDGFKIEDIITVDEDTYFQIKFLISGRQAVIPFEDNNVYYKLFPDKDNIAKLPNIINTDIPYFGSEIKYWFFMNNINLDQDKYINFKLLITASKHMIADYKLYYLKAEYLPLEDKYINCRAVLFKTTS